MVSVQMVLCLCFGVAVQAAVNNAFGFDCFICFVCFVYKVA